MAHTLPIDHAPPPQSRPTPPSDRRQPPMRAEEVMPREDQPARGVSVLNESTTDEGWQRWREIQANFVDEPRKAVGEAHELVSHLMDQIVRNFDEERHELEQRWQSGSEVSTDELRHCLQRYRDFFGRLLTNTRSRES